MTSGHAPPIIPSVEIGTIPGEWSEFVLASSPASDTPTTFSEGKGSKETPAVPGSTNTEPRGLEEQPSDEPKPTTTTRDQPTIGATVAQAAKQYMPEQTGKVVEHLTQIAAAAASYLPDPQGIKDTVPSYLSSEQREEAQHVSLPSAELKGAQPSEHTGGVGALPGNLSESSVALLPDERQERDQESRSDPLRQRRDTIKPSTTGGENESRELDKEAGAPLVPGASDAPSTGTEGSAEAVEFGSSETKSQQTRSEGLQAAGVAATSMVGTAPAAEEVEKGVGENAGSTLAPGLPGEPKDPSRGIRQEGSKEGATMATKEVEGGHDGEYHPAQLHPPPPGASVAEYQSSLGVQQEERESPTTRTAKRPSVSGEKKPGLMTVMKGEMKILAGKVSGDEHKVEEGRKIVHGDA